MFKFSGKHFIVSYLKCDITALNNIASLKEALEKAINSSNATILSSTDFVFDTNGYTAIYLLSESHASIHTYPEHNSCFVDLFTCGDHCTYKEFNKIMKDYLKAKVSNSNLIVRNEINTIL